MVVKNMEYKSRLGRKVMKVFEVSIIECHCNSASIGYVLATDIKYLDSIIQSENKSEMV